ncbi:MAG: hypothetical protein HEP71_12400 [Roseivirga sp.]|nr:hypothetical protein [Roseivirga sp.]
MDSFKPVIEEIEKRLKSVSDEKIEKSLNELILVFEDLDRREIPTESVADLLKRLKNILVAELQLKQINRLKTDLLSALRKQYGLVTPKYYQTLWMILGMTIFGVPFGMIFSLAIDNMAFLGLGFGFGMPIGMAIGIAKDKKALEDGMVINGVQQAI